MALLRNDLTGTIRTTVQVMIGSSREEIGCDNIDAFEGEHPFWLGSPVHSPNTIHLELRECNTVKMDHRSSTLGYREMFSLIGNLIRDPPATRAIYTRKSLITPPYSRLP